MTGTSTPTTVVRLLPFATCLWFAVCSTGAGKAHAEEVRLTNETTAAPPERSPSLRFNGAVIPITAGDPSCGPSALYNRTIDYSRYEYGCPEIEAMMVGPKHYIAGGNSRDVFLVDYEGHKLVLKTTKHESAHLSTRHAMEAIALDVVIGAPYIAPTLGVCGTASVQPFFAGGTVEGLVFEGAWTGVPIEMPVVLQMSLDAMRGLQVLHEAPGGPIIHNAIRPEQLLRYANGTVVVSDLNSCNFMGVTPSGEACPTRSDISHNARWNAPEFYADGQGYTEMVDIYSMAIVFWQLVSLRTVPFESKHRRDIPDLVASHQRPFVDPSWDPHYAQLLQDMWRTDPEMRPSARQVVARLEEMLQ
ncbi:similar to TAK1 (TGF-beta-activated kinase) [Ectocarpus siliculosus]|uniref:Similar to TAK1 (TGF-beta-activated kinase) n=1 Tax=Ectocarpus siliculosus TaxID=2880 RepID=D7FHD3_ECTSI|nr:similar to TAK1 (TGF-beta-activated kinase) [Ectocarpus siliculosus]|eukprot:CBJ28500.1 similar to TAK1 (TGF-beta-activated kinase) [Ectocarpus siliculosus]